MRAFEEVKSTDNRRVLNRLRRYELRCSWCRPHKCDNGLGRRPRSDRHKNHRRG